jgi:RNA polymerase sigma-B factor
MTPAPTLTRPLQTSAERSSAPHRQRGSKTAGLPHPLDPQADQQAKPRSPGPGRSTDPSITRRGGDDYAHVIDLFARIASLPADDPERELLRSQIIVACLPLAHNIARRYRGRGQPHDDLLQVACLALVNAVHRFDLGKGKNFVSFAVPTMMGEIRRYFRDFGWDVHVPRSLQENYLALTQARCSLTHTFGREPTAGELAAEIGVEPDQIAQITAAGGSYHSASLDAPLSADGALLEDVIGDYDTALDAIDDHETLRPALLALSERARAVVLYRFFGELTQSEIAAKIGISQMHVSRILTQSLTTLRTELNVSPS